MFELNVANFIRLDGGVLWAGDTYEGKVYVAEVPEEGRFKYANWRAADKEQTKVYWDKQRENRLSSPEPDHCPETGESVYFCTCGWH